MIRQIAVLAFCLSATPALAQSLDTAVQPEPVDAEELPLAAPMVEPDIASEPEPAIPFITRSPFAPVEDVRAMPGMTPKSLRLQPLNLAGTALEEPEDVAAVVETETPPPLVTDTPISPTAQQVIRAQITATQLSTQDIAALGVLTEADGGFPTQIWRDTKATDILAAMRAAPADAPSPAIQDALRRLMLTIASAPAVSDRGAWVMVRERVNLLRRMGELPGALALLARVPADTAPDRLLQQKVETALLAEDWPVACAAAEAGLSRKPGPYWTEISIVCNALAGQRDAVDLAYDLMGPGERPTRFSQALIEYALAVNERQQLASLETPTLEKPEWPRGQERTPLFVALAGTLGIEMPEVDLGQLGALDISALASSDRLPVAQRWAPTLVLANSGKADASNLLQMVYATPQDAELDFVGQDLLLELRQALSARRDDLKLRRLLALSKSATQAGQDLAWVPVVGESLRRIAPAKTFWPESGAVAAHLAIANAPSAVVRWYDQIRSGGDAQDVDAAAALISVWPYAVATAPGGAVPYTPRILELWWTTQEGNAQEVRTRQATYVFTILEALGYPVPPELWANLSGDGAYIPGQAQAADVTAKLEDAVVNGQTGHAVLLAMQALGPTGTYRPTPSDLRAALRGLVRVGQAPLARRLAAEVLYFAGVSLGADG